MGTTIYGMDSQSYRRLAPEDQASVRQAYEQSQPTEAPDTPAPGGTSEAQPTAAPAAPMNPQDAKTPQEAIAAINAMPLPDMSDLQGMPPNIRDPIYKQRVEAFNRARQEAAEQALARFAPQRSQFDGLPNETANAEYRQAQSDFDNSPYVRELKRIAQEAKDNPTSLPSYLTSKGQPSDPQSMPVPQLREVLAKLGIELPENASPEMIKAGYEIVTTIPPHIYADLINPGMQVSFSAPVGGTGTSPHLPVRGGAGLAVEGQVDLSNVYTGVDFEQTQTFQMSLQLQAEASGKFGKTPLNYAYEAAKWTGNLSQQAKDMVNSSPALKFLVKGPGVYAGSTNYSGSRLHYEAVVTPAQGKAIAEGHLEWAPNPLDPMNMPVGSSVLIRGQSLEGSEFQAGYSFAAGVRGTHTSLEGTGFGVRRLDGSVVEVSSGPVKTVENGLYLGAGRPGILSAGVSAEQTSEQQQVNVARIDLSTAEGQAAYQQFINTGQVPSWNPPGVQQSGTTTILSGEQAVRAGFEVGSAQWGWGDARSVTIARTQWQDGTVEQTNTFVSGPNHTSEVKFQIGADGKAIDSSTTFKMVLGNYDPRLASFLNGSFVSGAEKTTNFDGKQHVQLTFTPEQLMQVRDQARAFLEKTGQGELLAAIDAGTAAATTLPAQLAAAKTPDEVFQILSADTRSGAIAQDLLVMTKDTGQTLPGQIEIRDAG